MSYSTDGGPNADRLEPTPSSISEDTPENGKSVGEELESLHNAGSRDEPESERPGL